MADCRMHGGRHGDDEDRPALELAGTLIPLTLNRFGVDPAVAAGPFLTTTTDVLGFFVFLGLASVFLL